MVRKFAAKFAPQQKAQQRTFYPFAVDSNWSN